MEFSAIFVHGMTRPFCIAQSIHPVSSLESNLTLDSNNVFSKSLVVDITGDDVEIPSMARLCYEDIIRNNLTCSNIEKVEKAILPLYTNCNDLSRRTFDSIMREFFCRVPFNQRLLKVTTSKG